jgi:dihydrodipicolinate synthase/N-acetylneuraminate lyase
MIPRGLELAGVFPPIPTPFGSDGRIEFDRLIENIDRWNGEPMTGVVVGSVDAAVADRRA